MEADSVASTIKQQLAKSLDGVKLPAYNEIPNVGLYLEQTTKYLNEYLEPLAGISLTNSMISNYVKKKLIASPVKKQYSREQIAHLFFIALTKSVLSLDNLQTLVKLQQESYTTKDAYIYFCTELEELLHEVFEIKPPQNHTIHSESEEKTMLHNIIATIAHKIYLDKYFIYLNTKQK